MKKLSRKALVLTYACAIAVLLFIGLFFIKDSLFASENKDASYTYKVVVESKNLTSVYIDSISSAKSSTEYSENVIEIEAGTEILGYTISNNQSFSLPAQPHCQNCLRPPFLRTRPHHNPPILNVPRSL